MTKLFTSKTILWLFFLPIILFTSCSVEHKEELMSSPIEAGTLNLPLNGGSIIKLGSNNLLSLEIDYPNMKVSSIFSNVSEPPMIKYVGQMDNISLIPLSLNDYFDSNTSTITNHGCYIIKMARYNAASSSSQKILIRMRIVEHIGITTADSSLDIQYQIFTTKESMSINGFDILL